MTRRSSRYANNPDPVFAGEMAALDAERSRAFVGDFRERWAERLTRPLPAGAVSKFHAHDEDCLGPEFATKIGLAYVIVRACSKGAAHKFIREG